MSQRRDLMAESLHSTNQETRPGLDVTLERWACILRYHRWSQLAWRAANVARRRLLGSVEARRYETARQVAAQPRENAGLRTMLDARLAFHRQRDTLRAADDLREGRFRFLAVERSLPDSIDWRLSDWKDAPPLWRFHLHYQDYVLDLAAAGIDSGDDAYLSRAWQLVAAWIEGNPLADRRTWGDAWHPYCIARRLPAWILLWTAAAPPEDLADRVLKSMAAQARFLEDHLEWDLGGNHLLEDLRGLAVAGAFFAGKDAARWLDKAQRILRRELREQILPHGEHFERAPMYHCLMLEAMLDIRDAAQSVVPDLAALCGDSATRMAKFLGEILHPDGEIPLFGDSVLHEAPSPRLLLARIGGRPTYKPNREPGARQIGGYWRSADGDDWLLFDAGPVGPDHLPAHAHADLLTIEASVAGRRLIVDSGVFNYQDDEMRQYCRGSGAHNVLTIDGADQCDVWSRFRMGRRGWPSALVAGESDGFSWVCASHDAFRRHSVKRVWRWLGCRPDGTWICVDTALGRGGHELTGWLHIHPDWRVAQVGPGEVCITCAETCIEWRALNPVQVEVVASWYCPEFGARVPNRAIRWTAEAAIPASCGWMISRAGCEGAAVLQGADGDTPSLLWREGGVERVIGLKPGA